MFPGILGTWRSHLVEWSKVRQELKDFATRNFALMIEVTPVRIAKHSVLSNLTTSDQSVFMISFKSRGRLQNCSWLNNIIFCTIPEHIRCHILSRNVCSSYWPDLQKILMHLSSPRDGTDMQTQSQNTMLNTDNRLGSRDAGDHLVQLISHWKSVHLKPSMFLQTRGPWWSCSAKFLIRIASWIDRHS